MKKRKQLLILTSTFPRWEDDEDPPFVFELCNRLTADYGVHVLAPHFPGSRRKANLSGIQVRRFRYFINPLEKLAYHGGIVPKLKKNPFLYILLPCFIMGELLALIKLLRHQQFDLIHAHWLIPQGLVAILACSLTGSKIPLLFTSHGGDLFGLQGNLTNKIKKWVILKSDALIVVSKSMVKEVKRIGAEHKRVYIIPMGVDLKSRFVPSESRSNSNTLLFVGRLVEKKGLYYLIHAMPAILKKNPQINLIIAGDGPEKINLKKTCKNLGISAHVRFLGAVRNDLLPELYQSSDVVVFPSVIAEGGDQEGLGLVLVEALGCECSAIVTDLPAMEDIIVHGKTGLVVPQKNIRKLAEKIILLLGDQKLRVSLGREGRRHVLRNFDWTVIVEKYKKLIDLVSAQPSTS